MDSRLVILDSCHAVGVHENSQPNGQDVSSESSSSAQQRLHLPPCALFPNRTLQARIRKTPHKDVVDSPVLSLRSVRRDGRLAARALLYTVVGDMEKQLSRQAFCATPKQRCDWLNLTCPNIFHVTRLCGLARAFCKTISHIGWSQSTLPTTLHPQLHALMPTAIRESGMGAKLLQAGLLDCHAASV